MVYFNSYTWLKITEKAAISCYPYIGRYDEKAADYAAVDVMRKEFNKMPVTLRVAIGEGERDKAPMLYIGEILGAKKDVDFDIAVDPLEGTTLCAHNMPNSMSVLAVSEKGGFLHAPDLYMEKIAYGLNLPKGFVDIDNKLSENIKNIAKFKNCNVNDITVAVLKRDRHVDLIKEIVNTGAKVKLFIDGDIAASIATLMPELNIDLYVGIGGAPEGVLAASAMKILGGKFQGRLIMKNDEDKESAARLGIVDQNRKYDERELVPGENIVFVATGVTDGFLLNGVKKNHDGFFITNSLLISTENQAIQYIKTDYKKDL